MSAQSTSPWEALAGGNWYCPHTTFHLPGTFLALDPAWAGSFLHSGSRRPLGAPPALSNSDVLDMRGFLAGWEGDLRSLVDRPNRSTGNGTPR